MLRHVRGCGLAVSPRDARDLQLARGASVKLRGQLAQRRAGGRKPEGSDAIRHLGIGLHRYRGRAGRDRVRDERVTVRADARHRHEQVARFHAPRVRLDAADLRTAIAVHDRAGHASRELG